MRSRKCRACTGWHDLDAPWPSACAAHFGERGPRSGLPMPMIIRDGMEPIQSMVSGQFHDSKRAYYAEVRNAGCEIVGDDKAGFGPRPTYEPQNVKQSIAIAIEQVEAGYVPPPEKDTDFAA